MTKYKCEICGGDCKLLNSKEYKCICCGNIFDIEPTPMAVSVAPPQNTGETVFDNCIDSVLEITCRNGNSISAGSGFIITKDGYAITNAHVVTYDCAPCCDVTVMMSGRRYSADVLALGDSKGGHGTGVDLALIRLNVNCETKPVKFCNFEKVKNGSSVYIIGNSLGQGTCITSGIISDKNRSDEGKTLVMTDCAINGGNSGGPMFNDHAEVVGAVVSSIKSAKGMNFAIPTPTVIDFINRLAMQIAPFSESLMK